MNSSKLHTAIIGVVAIGSMIVVPFVVKNLVANSREAERRARFNELSDREKELVQVNYDRFERIRNESPGHLDELRLKHKQLKDQPELVEAAVRYRKWLTSLPFSQQTEIRQIQDSETRYQYISRLLEKDVIRFERTEGMAAEHFPGGIAVSMDDAKSMSQAFRKGVNALTWFPPKGRGGQGGGPGGGGPGGPPGGGPPGGGMGGSGMGGSGMGGSGMGGGPRPSPENDREREERSSDVRGVLQSTVDEISNSEIRETLVLKLKNPSDAFYVFVAITEILREYENRQTPSISHEKLTKVLESLPEEEQSEVMDLESNEQIDRLTMLANQESLSEDDAKYHLAIRTRAMFGRRSRNGYQGGRDPGGRNRGGDRGDRSSFGTDNSRAKRRPEEESGGFDRPGRDKSDRAKAVRGKNK